MPEGVILGFDVSLLISLGIQWLNIMVLSFVIYILLYKPVQNYMDARASRIKSALDEASDERKRVDNLRVEYESLIGDIEVERDEILHRSHRMAVEHSDQLLFAARSEADEIHRRAIEEIERLKKRGEDDVKRNIIEISTLMAGRFVEVSVSPEDHDRFIKEAVSSLEIS